MNKLIRVTALIVAMTFTAETCLQAAPQDWTVYPRKDSSALRPVRILEQADHKQPAVEGLSTGETAVEETAVKRPPDYTLRSGIRKKFVFYLLIAAGTVWAQAGLTGLSLLVIISAVGGIITGLIIFSKLNREIAESIKGITIEIIPWKTVWKTLIEKYWPSADDLLKEDDLESPDVASGSDDEYEAGDGDKGDIILMHSGGPTFEELVGSIRYLWGVLSHYLPLGLCLIAAAFPGKRTGRQEGRAAKAEDAVVAALREKAMAAISEGRVADAIITAIEILKLAGSGAADAAEKIYKKINSLEAKRPGSLKGNRHLLAVLAVKIRNARKAAMPVKRIPLTGLRGISKTGLRGISDEAKRMHTATIEGREVSVLEMACRGLLTDSLVRALFPPALELKFERDKQQLYTIKKAAGLSGRTAEEIRAVHWLSAGKKKGRERLSAEDVELLRNNLTAKEAARYTGGRNPKAVLSIIRSGRLAREEGLKPRLAVTRDSVNRYVEAYRAAVPIHVAYLALHEIHNNEKLSVAVGKDYLERIAARPKDVLGESMSRALFGDRETLILSTDDRETRISLWDLQAIAELIQSEALMRSKRSKGWMTIKGWMTVAEVAEKLNLVDQRSLREAIARGEVEAEEPFFLANPQATNVAYEYLIPPQEVKRLRKQGFASRAPGSHQPVTRERLTEVYNVASADGKVVNAFDEAIGEGGLSDWVYNELCKDAYPIHAIDAARKYTTIEISHMCGMGTRDVVSRIRRMVDGKKVGKKVTPRGRMLSIPGTEVDRIVNCVSAYEVKRDIPGLTAANLIAFAANLGEDNVRPKRGVGQISTQAANTAVKFWKTAVSAHIAYLALAKSLEEEEGKMPFGKSVFFQAINDPAEFFGQAKARAIFGRTESLNVFANEPQYKRLRRKVDVVIDLMDLSRLVAEIRRQIKILNDPAGKTYREAAADPELGLGLREEEFESFRELAVEGNLGCELVDFVGSRQRPWPVFSGKNLEFLPCALEVHNEAESLIGQYNFVLVMNNLNYIWLKSPETAQQFFDEWFDGLGTIYRQALCDTAIENRKSALAHKAVTIVFRVRGQQFVDKSIELSKMLRDTENSANIFTQAMWILYLMLSDSKEEFLRRYVSDGDVEAISAVVDKLGNNPSEEERLLAQAGINRLLQNPNAKKLLGAYGDRFIQAALADINGRENIGHICQIELFGFDWKRSLYPGEYKGLDLGRNSRPQVKMAVFGFDRRAQAARDLLRSKFHYNIVTKEGFEAIKTWQKASEGPGITTDVFRVDNFDDQATKTAQRCP